MIKLKAVSHQRTFEELVRTFDSWFEKWKPIENSFEVEEFFGEGLGVAKSLRKLKANGIIDSCLDFKGIYLFQKKGRPFYAGISKHVVKRLIQHVKGKNHFSSSLSYKLGADAYLKRHGKVHYGGREGLDFETYAEPAKYELMKCEVSIFAIESDLELYLFEVYLSMRLNTLYYNEFRTH